MMLLMLIATLLMLLILEVLMTKFKLMGRETELNYLGGDGEGDGWSRTDISAKVTQLCLRLSWSVRDEVRCQLHHLSQGLGGHQLRHVTPCNLIT